MTEESTVAPFTVADYDEAVAAIQARTAHRPQVGMILGSGLSGLAESVEAADSIDYGDLPHFPVSTVAGHAGRLVIGELAGLPICVMQGRFHYYEGYTLQQVTLPIRVMQRMGIKTLILTNAAGGMNPAFAVGDLMLIEDHINFLGMAGNNPLRGPNLDAFGPRFPAANRVYTKRLRDLTARVAYEQNLPLHRGVYCMVGGPNFETPAEIRMLRVCGVDTVGMSTVPEALVAHHAEMEVLAISTITNLSIDTLDAAHEPTHVDISEAGKLIVPRLTKLLMGVVTELGRQHSQA